MEKRKDLSIREVISTNQQFFLGNCKKDAQEIVDHEKRKNAEVAFVSAIGLC